MMSTESDHLSQERNVIVVLGVGRSGTSLAMQALESMGMRVSKNVIPADVSNPKGFYEDADIVEIHKKLLGALTPNPTMPLREGWKNDPITRKKQQELKELVERQVEAGPGIWGFKDPRTATFLPIWIRVFNQLKIVPRFVLAVRRPEAIIQSFSQQYSNDQAFAELIFLMRTLDALYHTGGDYHMVQYEHWFLDPEDTMQRLSAFALGDTVSTINANAFIEKRLNRASTTHVEIRNPAVATLYRMLIKHDSGEITTQELMQYVHQQTEALQCFSPWFRFSDKQKKQREKLEEQLRQLQKDKQLMQQSVKETKQLKSELTRSDRVIKELRRALEQYENLIV